MRFGKYCLSLLCIVCFIFGTTFGCGRSATVSLSGKATLDGQPLPTGTIILIPTNKAGGPSVGTGIVEGHYHIPAGKGLLRGHTYRVEIRSIDPASGAINKPPVQGLPEYVPSQKLVYKDRVPPVFNSASQLTLAVPDDATTLQHDFELKWRKGDKSNY
jgi:hypothetical protein